MSYNPPLIRGPIAPENNPPINPQFYQPRVFNISAISTGVTTTVTTRTNHDYVVGQLTRLLIAQAFGSYQLNEKQAYVISIPATNQVVLDLDSTLASPFIYDPTSSVSQPQIIPIGDANSGQINTGRTGNLTYIPGSFIDISPA